MKTLSCGHPVECLRQDDEDESYCAWCNQVASMQTTIDGLKSVLHKDAVIVYGGTVNYDRGDIGYLEMHGGNFTVRPLTLTTFTIPEGKGVKIISRSR